MNWAIVAPALTYDRLENSNGKFREVLLENINKLCCAFIRDCFPIR